MNNGYLPHFLWFIAILWTQSSNCQGQVHKNINYIEYDKDVEYFVAAYNDREEVSLTIYEKDSLRKIIIRDILSRPGVKVKKLGAKLELYYFFRTEGNLMAYVQYYWGSLRKFEKEYGPWKPIWLSDNPDFSRFYFSFTDHD